MSLSETRRRNGVKGYSQNIRTSITRPADTTAYTAGDVVGTNITFPAAAPEIGGAGVILGTIVLDSANQATTPVLELWIFNDAVSTITDNAPLALSDTDLLKLVTVIPLSTTYISNAASGANGNGCFISPQVAAPFECLPTTADLYGFLVVRNTYTPVSQEIFTIQLNLLQD